MSREIPKIMLGEILTPISRPESVDPLKTYSILGAHWYAEGLYIKDTKSGSSVQADKVYRVEEGDFVYNRLFAWKGSFAIATDKNHGCYVSNEFPTFVVNSDKADARYLWKYFSRASSWEEALNLSSGGTPTSRNRLKEEKLLAMEIPLPPLEEQRRIVARIEELASRIEEARRLRREAVEEADMLLSSSRTNFFENVPQQNMRKLSDLATLERGKFSHRPRNDPYFFGGDHPWIQIAEIEQSGKYIRGWTQTLNDEGLSISKKFPRGTLLISIAATIGAVGILDFDCCIPDSIVAVMPKTGIKSEYLYHYFGYVRNRLEFLAPQSAQKNINLEILSTLPIPLLDISHQKNIILYLDTIQTQIDTLKRKQAQANAELDALLPSILDKAFKGEL